MGSATKLNLSKVAFDDWGPAGDQILIRGDSSVETIVGSSAVDHMLGGGGGDNLIVGGGKDILRGGLGDDVYTVNVFGEAIELAGQGDLVRTFVSYTLGTNIERLTLIGTGNIAGNGNATGNVLIGNSGDNLLNGRGGRDQLTGGEGADGFAITGIINAATNADRIEDFEIGIDTLRLDDAIFVGLTAANKAGAFHAGAAAADANDRIIYNPTTGAIFFDADGKGGEAQIRFATLDAGLDLQASDIVII